MSGGVIDWANLRWDHGIGPRRCYVGNVCVYEYEDGTYAVSANNVWVTGSYSSPDAALAAVDAPPSNLAVLWGRIRPRPMTLEEVCRCNRDPRDE